MMGYGFVMESIIGFSNFFVLSALIGNILEEKMTSTPNMIKASITSDLIYKVILLFI